MDCSPPGSFVHGTLQARRLEWVAVSYSQILPDRRIEPVSLVSLALQEDSLPLAPPRKCAKISLVYIFILMREEGTPVIMLCKNVYLPFTALLVMTSTFAQNSAHLSSSVRLHVRSVFAFSSASLSSLSLLILFSA